MKLLIELDEEYVKSIDKIRFLVGGRTYRKLQLEIIKAIKNGKALEQEPVIDKIRAEIAELSHYYPMGHDYQIAITRCIAVIDKYRAGGSSRIRGINGSLEDI